MTKWTPGPWVRYFDNECNHFYIAQQDGAPYTPNYSDVACMRVETYGGEYHAIQQSNANLIAAAPELYEALDSLANHFPPCATEGEFEALNAAYAALAKARGESND